MENSIQHSLSLENRTNLTVSGVSDVDEFNEQELLVICDTDELLVKGELLHIEELSLDSGTLVVSGKVNSLTYSEKLSGKSVFKRLFSG